MSDDILEGIFTKATAGKVLIKDRKTLTIDYVPEKLPFRDEEAKTIAQTLSIVLKGARPSNLLLFGKPGTGKTAVIKNIVNRLQKESKGTRNRSYNAICKRQDCKYRIQSSLRNCRGNGN